MKNLIEELQKLNNEEEYNVPSDFKQKVIAKIEKESTTKAKIKYVIPILSSAAVIMIVMFFATTGRVNDLALEQSTDIMNANYIEKDMNVEKTDGLYDTTFEVMNGAAISADEGRLENLKTEATQVPNYSKKDFYAEIIDILKTNNVSATLDDNSVKAKCSKTEAEEILFYYEGQITIEINGEYVIIK